MTVRPIAQDFRCALRLLRIAAAALRLNDLSRRLPGEYPGTNRADPLRTLRTE